MAPTIRFLSGLLTRRNNDGSGSNILGYASGPLAEARSIISRGSAAIVKRDVDPSKGVVDPNDINNAGFFVLFALIGVAFVLTGIWFFFWAKQGGFVFKNNDWDDYKSTVLRRKGPNGTILSNATKSTKLGGGSVYKDIAEDDTRTVFTEGTYLTEGTYMTGITAGASDIGAREERMRKKERRDRERERRRRERGEKPSSSRRHMGVDGVEDEEAERKAKEQLRSYRHEKAARVGGLNKESEGSQWDGSTVPSEATRTTGGSSSDVRSSRRETREKSKTRTTGKTRSKSRGKSPGGGGTPPGPAVTVAATTPGIRKVYSTADRDEARAEAKRLTAQGRVARRDFSFERSVAGTESMVTESLLEGSDTGTKSYHHPMPELRVRDKQREREREREERRARRGGYKRGRTEDVDELD